MADLRRSLALALTAVCLHLSGSCQSEPASKPAESPLPTPPPVSSSPALPVDEPARGDLRRRTVYVPAYSHIPRNGKSDVVSQLSILLSVRNVDPTAAVTLTHVDYFDTSGHRVRRYLDQPKVLRPLETAEFTVDTFDDKGGSGANFLVYWEGPSDAHPLLTETVMVGHLGAGHVAFASRGVELSRPLADTVDAAREEPSANAP